MGWLSKTISFKRNRNPNKCSWTHIWGKWSQKQERWQRTTYPGATPVKYNRTLEQRTCTRCGKYESHYLD